MTGKAVSIYDIAKLAGVSTATVSKVLNGKGSISQATRERVLDIARQEGYVASYAARTLSRGDTHTVGILAPDVSNPFFSGLVRRIETLLYDAGYVCFVCDTGNDVERARRNLESLAQRQVSGLVLVNGRYELGDLGVADGLPVVEVDSPMRTARPWTVSVVNDFSAMARDAVRLLARRGCRRIALLSVFTGATSSDGEWMGLRATLAEFGLTPDRNLVLVGPHRKESRVEAAELVGQCLDDGYAMDGIVCLGDRIALGACQALRERGLGIGRDVLVVGMDNSLFSQVAVPAISSVDRHEDEMAERGVEALLSMMGGEEPDEDYAVIGYDIVERESTLGPAARSPQG